MGVEEGVVNPVSASLLAAWAHHGQTDKGGRPYTDHPGASSSGSRSTRAS